MGEYVDSFTCGNTEYDFVDAQAREDISDLKSALNQKIEYIDKTTGQQDVSTLIAFPNINKTIIADGSIVSTSGYAVTDYIDLDGITGIYRTGQIIKYTLWRYAFYDASYNVLAVDGNTTDYTIESYDGKQVTWLNLNANAKYIRIAWDTSRAYEYYFVTQEDVATSYTTVPIIINGTNIYEAVQDVQNVVSAVNGSIYKSSGNNVIEPSLLSKKGYYYDFQDGYTHIDNASAQVTAEFIPFDYLTAYIRQNYSDVSNNALIIYCYDVNKNFLGYVATSYAIIGSTSLARALPTWTAFIRFYTNDPNVTGDKICISGKSLASFEPYETVYKIDEKSLAEMANKLPLYGKVIANFGDSIFGNKRPPYDVSTSLAKITGATVYNLGFGGCRMSQHASGWDAFSMYRLADAIATNDFTIQNAVDVDSVSGMPQYFKETRTLLESIDFNAVDIITISYGTNDFTAGISLDNPNNAYDTTTFCGALRYSLEKILEAYPQLHVFVCTPTWRFWIDSNLEFLYDSDTHEINGKLLTDFVEAVQDVSKKYHMKSIDNYYDLGIDKFNRSHWFPTNDGTHHNTDGGMLIAQHMANEMF